MKRVDGPTRLPEDARPGDEVAVVRYRQWTEIMVTWMQGMPPTIPRSPEYVIAPAHRSTEFLGILDTLAASGIQAARAAGTGDGTNAGEADPTGADGRHWGDQGL
jgi:hypothetical protein